MNALTIIRGDDTTLTVTFTYDDGSAVDITNAKVFFTVKKKVTDSDDDALIAKMVDEHTDADGGITEIELTHTDTSVKVGRYYFDLQVVTTAGKVLSISFGEFVVQADITQRTEESA